MPIPHRSAVDILPDIDKSRFLDTGAQHGCNLIEVRAAEGISNISLSEEDIGPGTTGTGNGDTIVVAEKSGTDFSELDVTIPGTAEDTIHFSDGSGPIRNPSSEETTIHNIETGFLIL
jgi:hypothetical protein